jgi:carboxylesterase type B
LHNHSVLEKQYGILLNVTGCSNLECLRSLPATNLANASQATYSVGYAAGDYGFGDFFYGPYVDGAVIRDLPSQEFKKGHFTKVPLLTNREGYEGTLFSNQNETNMTQEVLDLDTLFPYAKQSFFNRLFELYPSSNFNSTFFQRSQLFGDFIICCPTYYMSTAVSDFGNPVYKLIFDAGAENHGSLVPFTETINLNGMKVLCEVGLLFYAYMQLKRNLQQRYDWRHCTRLLHFIRQFTGPQCNFLYQHQSSVLANLPK